MISGVVVVEEPKSDTHVSNLRDGDLAVITNWGTSGTHLVGAVVQRFRADLLLIGRPSCSRLSNIWAGPDSVNSDSPAFCRVRKLLSGSTLQVL